MGTQNQTLDQIVQTLKANGKEISNSNADPSDHSLRNPTRAQLSTALIHRGATLSKGGRSYSWEEENDLLGQVSRTLYTGQLSARADLLYGNEDGGEIPFDETDLIRAITFAARTAIASHATMASQRTPQAIALSKFLRNGGLGGHYIGTENGRPLVANRDGELLSQDQIQEKIDAVREHIMPEDIVCATAMTLGYDEERVQEDQEWLVGSFARNLPADWETPITPARVAQTVAKGMRDLANVYFWQAIPVAVENILEKTEGTKDFQAVVMSRLHNRYVPINESGATTVLGENKQSYNIGELVGQTVKDVMYDMALGKITLGSSKSSADQTKYDELSREVDRLTTLLGEYEIEFQTDARRIEELESDLASSRTDAQQQRELAEEATAQSISAVAGLAKYQSNVTKLLGVNISLFEEALPEGAGPVLTYIGGLNSALADRDSRIKVLEAQVAGADAHRDAAVEAALERGEEAATKAYGADLAVLVDRVAHLNEELASQKSEYSALKRVATRDKTLLGESQNFLTEALEANSQWQAKFAEKATEHNDLETRYADLDANYNTLCGRAKQQAEELGVQDRTIASYQEGQRMLTSIARAKGMIAEEENLTAGNFETALDRLVVPYKARAVAAEEQLRQATQKNTPKRVTVPGYDPDKF